MVTPLLHFGDYLRAELADGHIDFQLRAQVDGDGRVGFYIHPAGKDGRTADYLFPDPSRPDLLGVVNKMPWTDE